MSKLTHSDLEVIKIARAYVDKVIRQIRTVGNDIPLRNEAVDIRNMLWDKQIEMEDRNE